MLTKFNGTDSGDGLTIDTDRLSRFVSTEMIRVGFMPSLKGFRYFKELLILSFRNHGGGNLMDMYSYVAGGMKTKSAVLERNIRTLITSSFYYNGIGFKPLSEYFGLPVDTHPPTVGLMLALMTEYLTSRLTEMNFSEKGGDLSGGTEDIDDNDGE